MQRSAFAITLLVLSATAACTSRPVEPPPAGADADPQRRPVTPLDGLLDGGFVDGAAFGGFHFVVDGGDRPRR